MSLRPIPGLILLAWSVDSLVVIRLCSSDDGPLTGSKVIVRLRSSDDDPKAESMIITGLWSSDDNLLLESHPRVRLSLLVGVYHSLQWTPIPWWCPLGTSRVTHLGHDPSYGWFLWFLSNLLAIQHPGQVMPSLLVLLGAPSSGTRCDLPWDLVTPSTVGVL